MKNAKTYLVFLTISFVNQSCLMNSQNGRKENFREQLGAYRLNLKKTDLGPYKKDSGIYKNVIIVFKADSSLEMNMPVPFIYDSVGTWVAGDMEEWNWLKLESFKYPKRSSGDQFTRPDYPDSTFILNSSPAKKGNISIKEIYFTKIKK